jgi:HEAT repeat protein
VLARLNKHNAVKYQEYIDELVKLFQTSKETKVQLTALESLGKLGYSERLPAIVADADTGTHGFNGMARWILSNSGKDADEDRLSELLLSKNEIDYRYAAYALRFKSHTNAKTVERLKTCLQALKADDPARVYVASALFVHSKPADRSSVKPTLLTYLSGAVGQRYEVAEALGLGGDKTDLPVLQKLLTDENTDVKVAAANAVLHIMHYIK